MFFSENFHSKYFIDKSSGCINNGHTLFLDPNGYKYRQIKNLQNTGIVPRPLVLVFGYYWKIFRYYRFLELQTVENISEHSIRIYLRRNVCYLMNWICVSSVCIWVNVNLIMNLVMKQSISSALMILSSVYRSLDKFLKVQSKTFNHRYLWVVWFEKKKWYVSLLFILNLHHIFCAIAKYPAYFFHHFFSPKSELSKLDLKFQNIVNRPSKKSLLRGQISIKRINFCSAEYISLKG